VPQLQLYGSVGPEEENDADDVANVSHSLAELGLPGARDAALSGAWDNRFDATVKSFQADSGLDVDDVLLPGGPTQVAINQSLEAMRRQLADAIRRGQVDARVFDAGQLSEIMKGAREIPGFTWHHHQDLGRMQLVPDKIHKRTLHIGGEGMKGGK
jgi:hypothetical protein